MVLKMRPNSAPVRGSVSMDETTMSGLREIARPIASMGDSVKDISNPQDASSPPDQAALHPLGHDQQHDDVADFLGANQGRRSRRQGAQDGVHLRLGGVDVGLEYPANTVDEDLDVHELFVAEAAGGFDVVLQPVGDDGDG